MSPLGWDFAAIRLKWEIQLGERDMGEESEFIIYCYTYL